MGPKYPQITVKLSGEDGNAFNVMGLVSSALKKAKVPQEEVNAYFKEAMAGDYDNLLQVTMNWVNVI